MSFASLTYSALTADLANILNTGATPNVTLYSNTTGTTLFRDASGNTFSGLVLMSINYTEPHNDSDGNQIKNGFLTLTFTNGSVAIVTDVVDTVFYSIVAVPFKPRTF
jgi:hypothetical protein